MNASQIDTRSFLSRSAASLCSALMKKSGKTVSKRCATESVAVMTIRRSPVNRSMNGKLADDVLTTTTRPGRLATSSAHCADSRSAPNQVELRVDAVVGAVPNQHDRRGDRRGSSNAARWSGTDATLAAVDADAGSGASVSTREGACDRSSSDRRAQRSESRVHCCVLRGVLGAAARARDDECIALAGASVCRRQRHAPRAGEPRRGDEPSPESPGTSQHPFSSQQHQYRRKRPSGVPKVAPHGQRGLGYAAFSIPPRPARSASASTRPPDAAASRSKNAWFTPRVGHLEIRPADEHRRAGGCRPTVAPCRTSASTCRRPA